MIKEQLEQYLSQHSLPTTKRTLEIQPACQISLDPYVSPPIRTSSQEPVTSESPDEEDKLKKVKRKKNKKTKKESYPSHTLPRPSHIQHAEEDIKAKLISEI